MQRSLCPSRGTFGPGTPPPCHCGARGPPTPYGERKAAPGCEAGASSNNRNNRVTRLLWHCAACPCRSCWQRRRRRLRNRAPSRPCPMPPPLLGLGQRTKRWQPHGCAPLCCPPGRCSLCGRFPARPGVCAGLSGAMGPIFGSKCAQPRAASGPKASSSQTQRPIPITFACPACSARPATRAAQAAYVHT